MARNITQKDRSVKRIRCATCQIREFNRDTLEGW